MPAEPDSFSVDVAIVGGGMVGTALAQALAQAGFLVGLVDRAAPAALTAPPYDGRASAIALGSKRILDGLGAWGELAALAGPILEIRVSDGDSTLHLHYDHKDVSDEPLGHIVENRHLRTALWGVVRTNPRILWRAPAEIAAFARGAGAAEVTLADGTRLRAALLVAADGRESQLRASAEIAVRGWSYPQTALVCAVRHEAPHRGIAHERFLPAGPFALLPLRDPQRASIVWTERAERAPHLLKLADQEFSAEMQHRFGDSLGRIAIEGARWTWPLRLHHADRYVARRLVLVGDAAHGIHPIAGQGLNLGLRDVAALTETLVEARRLGLDIGAPDVLERYERWRRPDNVALLVSTDALNRLFSNDIGPIRLVRDLGLAMVNRAPPLKALFMRHAMGLLGDLPRLTHGEMP